MNTKGIDFFKQKIKERLKQIKDDIPEIRYKLWIASIDACDDYNSLKEMAELDMQIEMFNYTRNEINPKIERLNLEIEKLRRANGLIESDKPGDYSRKELTEDFYNPEITLAMCALLAEDEKNEDDDTLYTEETCEAFSQIDTVPDDELYIEDEEENEEDDLFSDFDEFDTEVRHISKETDSVENNDTDVDIDIDIDSYVEYNDLEGDSEENDLDSELDSFIDDEDQEDENDSDALDSELDSFIDDEDQEDENDSEENELDSELDSFIDEDQEDENDSDALDSELDSFIDDEDQEDENDSEENDLDSELDSFVSDEDIFGDSDDEDTLDSELESSIDDSTIFGDRDDEGKLDSELDSLVDDTEIFGESSIEDDLDSEFDSFVGDDDIFGDTNEDDDLDNMLSASLSEEEDNDESDSLFGGVADSDFGDLDDETDQIDDIEGLDAFVDQGSDSSKNFNIQGTTRSRETSSNKVVKNLQNVFDNGTERGKQTQKVFNTLTSGMFKISNGIGKKLGKGIKSLNDMGITKLKDNEEWEAYEHKNERAIKKITSKK